MIRHALPTLPIILLSACAQYAPGPAVMIDGHSIKVQQSLSNSNSYAAVHEKLFRGIKPNDNSRFPRERAAIERVTGCAIVEGTVVLGDYGTTALVDCAGAP